MSQYINFWMKPKNGKAEDWICLGDFSRSSAIYSAAGEHVPYGHGIALTKEWFVDTKNEIRDTIKKYEREIDCQMRLISNVLDMQAPVNERLEVIEELNRAIEDLKLEIDEWTAAESWYAMLYNIADATAYDEVDYNATAIWAGIDWDPTHDEGWR